MNSYALEDVRCFVIKRQWLAEHIGLNQDEFASLKKRSLSIPKKRLAIMRAFMFGYMKARS